MAGLIQRLAVTVLMAAVLAAFFVAPPAGAQTMCGERAAVAEKLEQKYGEYVVSVGRISDNALAELFLSATGTWTLLVTYPDGLSCLLTSGDTWTDTPNPKAGGL